MSRRRSQADAMLAVVTAKRPRTSTASERPSRYAPTHYMTLDVMRTATCPELKATYRRKALAVHPDKGGSESAFCMVTDAFDVLIDPRKRAECDAMLVERFQGSEGCAGFSPEANVEGRATALASQFKDVDPTDWPHRLRFERMRVGGARHLESFAHLMRWKHANASAVTMSGRTSRDSVGGPMKLRGIMRSVRNGQVMYHVRMSHKRLVIESPWTPSLTAAIAARAEVISCKARAEQVQRSSSELTVDLFSKLIFGYACTDLRFTCDVELQMLMGKNFRVQTPWTSDVFTVLRHSQRLRDMAAQKWCPSEFTAFREFREKVLEIELAQARLRASACDVLPLIEEELMRAQKGASSKLFRLHGKQAPRGKQKPVLDTLGHASGPSNIKRRIHGKQPVLLALLPHLNKL